MCGSWCVIPFQDILLALFHPPAIRTPHFWNVGTRPRVPLEFWNSHSKSRVLETFQMGCTSACSLNLRDYIQFWLWDAKYFPGTQSEPSDWRTSVESLHKMPGNGPDGSRFWIFLRREFLFNQASWVIKQKKKEIKVMTDALLWVWFSFLFVCCWH